MAYTTSLSFSQCCKLSQYELYIALFIIIIMRDPLPKTCWYFFSLSIFSRNKQENISKLGEDQCRERTQKFCFQNEKMSRRVFNDVKVLPHTRSSLSGPSIWALLLVCFFSLMDRINSKKIVNETRCYRPIIT